MKNFLAPVIDIMAFSWIPINLPRFIVMNGRFFWREVNSSQHSQPTTNCSLINLAMCTAHAFIRKVQVNTLRVHFTLACVCSKNASRRQIIVHGPADVDATKTCSLFVCCASPPGISGCTRTVCRHESLTKRDCFKLLAQPTHLCFMDSHIYTFFHYKNRSLNTKYCIIISLTQT